MEQTRKYLWLAARILIAAAGVAYIAIALNWSDSVLVTGPTTLGETGVSVASGESVSLRIVGEMPGHPSPDEPLVLRGEVEGQPIEVTVEAGAVSVAEGSTYQFKPGIVRTVGGADLSLLLGGLAIVSLIFPIQMLRWWVLMRARKLDVSMWNCFRLLMVGTFFNFCMPGTTGGDLVKAYYAAKNSARRADSVMSILVDRVSGLLGLVVLAAIVGLFNLHDPAARSVTFYIWVALGLFVLGSAVYFSYRLRKLVRLDWWLSKLPFGGLVKSVDTAAVAYGNHKPIVLLTIAMSVAVHAILATATALAGYALGIEAPLLLMLTVVPVVFLAAAAPISYQGVGIMEAVAMPLLLGAASVSADANQIIAMLFLIRLYQIAYALLGSVFLLKGDIHMHPQRAVEAGVVLEPDDLPAADGAGQAAAR